MADVPENLPGMADYLPPDFYKPASAEPPAPKKSFAFWAGVKAGAGEAAGSLGSLVGAAGNVLGLPSVQHAGESFADTLNQWSQRQGIPAYEGSPFAGGISGFLPRLAYQAGKITPTLATIAAAPEIAVPERIAALGARAPAFLGGAGVKAGVAATAPELATGAKLASTLGTGTAVLYPQVAGGMYEQERTAPGGPTPGESARALGLGLPVAAIGALQPSGLLRGQFEGGLVSRVLKGGAENAAAGALAGGVSAAADTTFRPDISTAEKMKSVVDATVTGATLGGALGGLFGGLHKKADQVTNEDLKTVVDGQLNLPGIESGAAPARPAAPVETPAAPVQAETLFTPEEMGRSEEPTS